MVSESRDGRLFTFQELRCIYKEKTLRVPEGSAIFSVARQRRCPGVFRAVGGGSFYKQDVAMIFQILRHVTIQAQIKLHIFL